MINEDYCSYEVAKLLKEKGFDCKTEHMVWYVNKQFSTGCHWNACTYKVGDITREYNNDCCISMPTHQMAMKWLREVHSLCICIYYLWPCGYEIDLYRIGKDTPISEFEAIREYGYDTYEDAVEAALKYVLENLI